jgi:nucleotide-binding universal stress UspA family protein
VLDSSNATTDAAAAWALSLARWYDADLHHVDAGKSVRDIARYGRRVAADLYVVSNRARRGRGYWRAGSFAAALGAAVTSPTLVVPGEAPPPDGLSSPFRTILSAIDFSDVSVRALSEALHLVQQSGGRLRLLHVMTAFPTRRSTADRTRCGWAAPSAPTPRGSIASCRPWSRCPRATGARWTRRRCSARRTR